MKTSELTGAQLDWSVAKCEGELDECDYYLNEYTGAFMLENGDASAAYCPSTLWNHGGPIIEREKLAARYSPSEAAWYAYLDSTHVVSFGTTPLIAAMRAYVASKLGEYVDVPF